MALKNSQIVENYLMYSKQMDNLLNNFKVNLQKENRQILGITQALMDKIEPIYSEDKTNLSLSYKLDNEFIINAVKTKREDELNEGETSTEIKYLLIELARVNFVSETINLINPSVINLLDQLINILDTEKNNINKQKEFLIEKNKSFWFRFFHRKVSLAISNMDEAIKHIDMIKKDLEKEKSFFFSELKEKIINDFSECIKYTYGLMNLRRSTSKDEEFIRTGTL